MLDEEINSAVDGLCRYVEEGVGVGCLTEDMEPLMVGRLEWEKLKPLKLVSSVNANFVGVDCSTIRLIPGNRFGVYVLRAAFAKIGVDRRPVLKFEEHIQLVTGDEINRMRSLEGLRFKYESELAIKVLDELNEGDFLLLDGTSDFGDKEQRRFSKKVYHECRGKGIILLTFAKNTKVMTPNGINFLTMLLTEDIKDQVWLYHPFKEANKDEHRYGDISFVKLSPLWPAAFRCDIMDYLLGGDLTTTLSELTAISQDASCLGYPVCLYLAHKECQAASPKLLYYRDLMEGELKKRDPNILRKVLTEETLASFRSQVLYGLKNPWEVMEPV